MGTSLDCLLYNTTTNYIIYRVLGIVHQGIYVLTIFLTIAGTSQKSCLVLKAVKK